jgi:hypothetical protein
MTTINSSVWRHKIDHDDLQNLRRVEGVSEEFKVDMTKPVGENLE